jgi:hypothetical protein
MAISQYPGSTGAEASVARGKASLTGEGAYDDRDIYRTYLAGIAANFAGATVLTAGASATTVTGNATAGTACDFLTGMPLGAAPTGGSVLPGDIFVLAGVPYNVVAVTNATNLVVDKEILTQVGATTDWFIVRSDVIRTPQAFNTVFGLWQPPLGIFNDDEVMGPGSYSFTLTPNSNYARCAVETKDPNFSAVAPYKLLITDVRFYAYMEKMSIPDGVRELYTSEMQVIGKLYSSNLQFTVPTTTYAISVFVQDAVAGSSPLMPPSMFKLSDNGDLYLTNIMLSYAGMNKPVSNQESKFLPAITLAGGTVLTRSSTNELQQRYHDTYEESGLDIPSGGCETFTDWLRRGPYYHFSFKRDRDNMSANLQIQATFNGPTTRLDASRLYIVAHYRKTAQITVQGGLVTSTRTEVV